MDNANESLFKFKSKLISWNKQSEARPSALGHSYRRWQADGADSGGTACGGSGRAVYPGVVGVEEEERRPFPSSPGTGADRKPWRRRTDLNL